MKNIRITPSITPRDSRALEDYMHDISQYPLLTVDDEVSLARKIHAGDAEALDRLVLGNVRFVISVAKTYQNQGLELADLISAGNIGLIEAARRFDETRGNRFCSYAVWWISQSILQSLGKDGRMVALPANQQALLSKIGKATSKLEQELGRTPTPEELTEYLDAECDKVNNLLYSAQKPVSLDAPTLVDEEVSVVDTLTDTSAPATDAALIQESLETDMAQLLSNIPQNESSVLKLYYGIGQSNAYSMDEIAMRLNISRERVRQLHRNGIKRLQRGTHKERFREYL